MLRYFIRVQPSMLLTLTLCVCSMVMSSTSSAESVSELNARGVEYYKAKKYEKALQDFQRAFRVDPSDKTIQSNLTNAALLYSQELFNKGDTEDAIDWLEYIIKIDPKNIKPLNQLGAFLIFEGEIAAAIFRLEESIEIMPKDLDAHFLLGEAYHKDNDVTAAIDQWEWIYKVDKDYPGLMNRLETALREEQIEYDFEGDRSRNFQVTYSKDAEETIVGDVLRILEAAYRNVGKSLGGVYPPSPIQVSLYTYEGFFESTQQGEHVSALYDGTKIRCPVIDKSGEIVELKDLEKRLTHEYVHVAVRHVARQNIPWWYNEGLAETLSGDLTASEKKLLTLALKRQAIFSFGDITPLNVLETFSKDELAIAYAQSHAAVELLKNKYGERRHAFMLQHLRRGLDAEEALKKTYRINYRTLESRLNSMINQF